MTREEMKKYLPIINAFCEGKTIEKRYTADKWLPVDDLYLNCHVNDYRIKSEYRPFNNTKECWNEALKHKPFGWVKRDDDEFYFIEFISYNTVLTTMLGIPANFKDAYDTLKFADGQPFGVKV